MKNLIYAFAAVAVLASCSASYSIKGTTDVSMLDGHKLYLKVIHNDEIKNLDSCDVVHGQFSFNGQADSAKVGAIFLGEENLMPVVIEGGDIAVTVNSARQSCTGTELNDKLSGFTDKYNQILSQLGDLEHQHSQAIMDGLDMQDVTAKLQQKADQLMADEEKLITEFIEENFDNVLAPFVFQMVTGTMDYPMFSPWIEALLSKATDTFKNSPYVKDFVAAAERNRDIMTGMEDPTPAPAPVQQPLDEGLTPNQLAE